ncbi:MAG TPA: FAD binding domain-containing protein [Chitinophagaceae bacterium]|nr:FAD binding domain-containing protein [Chitinophagaceae bacterium]
MIQFILNNQTIKTSLPAGSTVLDFVRYHKRLMGTKIGCREGDCGACAILVGSVETGELVYRSMTSCLMPLGNANGKHIVTVEGINSKELSPVQQALVDTNGTQCGFCTLGFVMSLTGFVINNHGTSYNDAISSIDGNICRCTGYKSIERAARILSDRLSDRPTTNTTEWLIKNSFIPAYFSDIKERLLQVRTDSEDHVPEANGKLIVGGGTDLVVQQHSMVKKSATHHFFDNENLKGITLEGNKCIIGASVTVTEFAESAVIQNMFPQLERYIKLIASTPIRNMATMAGNLVNASPIGDMTIIFLALNAEIVLRNGENMRTILLKNFYKGYKQLEKKNNEFIERIIFTKPSPGAVFNFEKVCKRTWLDIASVNSASLIELNKDGTVKEIHLSAGGVAPFPKYLANTVAFLKGKKIDKNVLEKAIQIMNDEIAPISDARGTKEYKRLLLRQLFIAHINETTRNRELIRQVLLKVQS